MQVQPCELIYQATSLPFLNNARVVEQLRRPLWGQLLKERRERELCILTLAPGIFLIALVAQLTYKPLKTPRLLLAFSQGDQFSSSYIALSVSIKRAWACFCVLLALEGLFLFITT